MCGRDIWRVQCGLAEGAAEVVAELVPGANVKLDAELVG
jgi:hypothetical protein